LIAASSKAGNFIGESHDMGNFDLYEVGTLFRLLDLPRDEESHTVQGRDDTRKARRSATADDGDSDLDATSSIADAPMDDTGSEEKSRYQVRFKASGTIIGEH
jgi:hypothetical protein